MAMKPLSFVSEQAWTWRMAALAAAVLSSTACNATQSHQTSSTVKNAQDVVIAAEPGTPRPPFRFSEDDDRFLDQVQHAAFDFLWKDVGPAGMVVDRSSVDIVSVAGVGFQLSAIPVGVERGWITREQGRERTLQILTALEQAPDNRKAGMFYHYLDGATASASVKGYEHIASTIDSAILFAGMIVASSYFGGEIAERADRMVAAVQWPLFVSGDEVKESERGFITLGWKPSDPSQTTGDGARLPFAWVDSGDEHRLVTFLAVAAPNPEHRVSPEIYYRLRRRLGEHPGVGTMVWFPWSGALFTAFFAHCWLNYSAMGPDDPSAFEMQHRARVDWWENSRRTVNMHRAKAIQNPKGLAGFGENLWGLNASDAAHGYAVPGLFPAPISMPGARPEFDYSPHTPPDDWGDGTVAPYTAGCSVMFEPHAAVAALRHYRSLNAPDGTPLVWRDPAQGGFGFLDAFNPGTGWVAPEYVAIDQGPLVLAIENARTGMVWELFHRHPWVREGMARLRLSVSPSGSE